MKNYEVLILIASLNLKEKSLEIGELHLQE